MLNRIENHKRIWLFHDLTPGNWVIVLVVDIEIVLHCAIFRYVKIILSF
jgi:hypothetical protein